MQENGKTMWQVTSYLARYTLDAYDPMVLGVNCGLDPSINSEEDEGRRSITRPPTWGCLMLKLNYLRRYIIYSVVTYTG